MRGKLSWVFCDCKGTFLFFFLCFLIIFLWWPRCWIIDLLYWSDICVVNIAGIVCLLALYYPALISHNHHVRGVGSFLCDQWCFFFLLCLCLLIRLCILCISKCLYSSCNLWYLMRMVWSLRVVKVFQGMSVQRLYLSLCWLDDMIFLSRIKLLVRYQN